MRYAALLLLPLIATSCNARPATDDHPERPPVKTGAEVLVESNPAILAGNRIGLITNHSAVVGSRHLVDVLDDLDGVSITALFGPEHGIRGDADAGAEVAGGRDTRTGAPIHSLYGQVRKPTPQMLKHVDVLVFDIQDIGARFYTYISTMGLAMQAAAENAIPFVVLDRPNPLGGEMVEGFILEEPFMSFVGMFPIPVTHGMTVGELARMIQGEKMLPGLETLALEVMPVENWNRRQQWPELFDTWVPPSPNIPDFETALIYPGACFFEGTSASEGRGTYTPFMVLGAPWADGDELAVRLNEADLPGVSFEAVTFSPISIEGMSSHPKLLGEKVKGIRYLVEDTRMVRPVETGVHVLHAFYHHANERDRQHFFVESSMQRLAGTNRLHQSIMDGNSPAEIVADWRDEIDEFRTRRAKYLLYE